MNWKTSPPPPNLLPRYSNPCLPNEANMTRWKLNRGNEGLREKHETHYRPPPATPFSSNGACLSCERIMVRLHTPFKKLGKSQLLEVAAPDRTINTEPRCNARRIAAKKCWNHLDKAVHPFFHFLAGFRAVSLFPSTHASVPCLITKFCKSESFIGRERKSGVFMLLNGAHHLKPLHQVFWYTHLSIFKSTIWFLIHSRKYWLQNDY